MAAPLYHYTCEHGRNAIGEAGMLKPIREHSPDAVGRFPPDLLWLADLVWLTDLDTPDVRGLGLTRSALLTCDRTRFRYTVTLAPHAVPFARWVRGRPHNMRREIMLRLVYDVPGALPAHWYISTLPVVARLG